MKKTLLTLLIFVGTFSSIQASHLKTITSSFEHIQGDVYRITVQMYRDCSGIICPSSVTGSFGCGSITKSKTLYLNYTNDDIGTNNWCDSYLLSSVCNGGSNYGVTYAVYTDTITLPNCGDWTWSTSSCCGPMVNNINSSGPLYYTNTTSYLSQFPGNSPPEIGLSPQYVINQNDTFRTQLTGLDKDGDSLFHSMVPVKINDSTNVAYNTGYSATNPFGTATPLLHIDSNGFLRKDSGIITLGSYLIGHLVEEFDPVTGIKKGESYESLYLTISPDSNSKNIDNGPTAMGLISSGGGTVNGNTIELCYPNTGFSFQAGFHSNNGQDVKLWSNSNLKLSSTGTNTYVKGDTSIMTINVPAGLMPGKHFITVSAMEDTCMFSSISLDTFRIIVHPYSNLGPDQKICLGDSLDLQLNQGIINSWSVLSGPPIDSTITSNNYNFIKTSSSSAKVFPNSTTTYVIQSNSTGFCSNWDTMTVYVDSITPLGQIDTFTLCMGDTMPLFVPTKYGAWSSFDGKLDTLYSGASNVYFLDTDSSGWAVFDSSTTLLIQGFNDLMGGCLNQDTMEVIVDYPVSIVAPLGSSMCPGDTLSLVANGTSYLPNNDFNWLQNATPLAQMNDTILVSPGSNTDFFLVSDSISSCVSADSISIIVSPNLIASNDTTICSGDTASLSVTGGSTFQWSNFQTLSCAWCSNTLAYPTITTTYYVNNNQTNCSNIDSVTVYVTNDRWYYGVLTDQNLNTIANTNVYMIKYNSADSTVTAIDSTLSDGMGAFSFTTTESDVYFKATPDSATYPNLVPTYYDSASLFFNAINVTSNPCDSVQVNVSIQGGNNPGGSGFISGNVYQGAGKMDGIGDPAEGVNLILMNLQNQEVKYWKTDANGHLQFTQLAYGTYKVFVDQLGIDNSQAPVIVVNEFSKEIKYDFKLNSKLLIRSSPNGIKHTEANFEFVIYPNPAENKIQLNITGNYDFEILSINGKSLLKRENYNTSHINISTLKPGVYLIKVKVNGTSSIQRFIKK